MSGAEQVPGVVEIKTDEERLARVIGDMIQAVALFAVGTCVACDVPADDLLAALRRCEIQSVKVAVDPNAPARVNGN